MVSAALSKPRPVIDVLAVLDLESIAHTPEGSEPTAAGGGRREASEWQRSKFCEANSEQRISGTATGRRFKSGSRNQTKDSETSVSESFFAYFSVYEVFGTIGI